MKSLFHQFVDWVGKQDREATFNPMDIRACVGFQFLSEAGFPVKSVGVESWADTGGVFHPFPCEIMKAIGWAIISARFQPSRVTFGALADHLALNAERAGL